MTLSRRNEVKKHSSAIHSKSKLSFLETKLSNVLLCNAYDHLLDKQSHSINLQSLATQSGFLSRDMATLRRAIQKLQTTLIEWDLLDEGDERSWGTSSMLSAVSIRKGVCTYEYSRMLSEKLSEPRIFGVINLEVQKTFTSGHALTVYEICSRYKGLLSKRNHCFSLWYPLEEFRQLLGVDDSEYYREFKHLNAKIIKPAVSEINGSLKKYAGTDIKITSQYKKIGNSITDIRFMIEPSCLHTTKLPARKSHDLEDTPLYSMLMSYELPEAAVIELIRGYEAIYLEEKLQITEDAVKNKTIKSSVSGFLLMAIRKDFRPRMTETDRQTKKRKEREALKSVELQKEALAKQEALRQAQASQHVRDEFIASLDDATRQKMFDELTSNLPYQVKKLVTGIDNPILADSVNRSIVEFDSKVAAELEFSLSPIDTSLA